MTSAQTLDSVLFQRNKVLSNTYLMLGINLLWSAGIAAIAMLLDAAPVNPWLALVVYLGLLFGIEKTSRKTAFFLTFVLTGAMGFTLGPILNVMLSTPNGDAIIMQGLGLTGIVFSVMSIMARRSRRDYAGSSFASMLFSGLLVAFLAGIASLFFQIPALAMAVSAVFALLSASLVFYQINQIVHGGENDYISATVTLFVSLYNLFLSFLNLSSILTGDD